MKNMYEQFKWIPQAEVGSFDSWRRGWLQEQYEE